MAKGGGVDCAHLLEAVYSAAGLMLPGTVGGLVGQYDELRSREYYLAHIDKLFDRVVEHRLGDMSVVALDTGFHSAVWVSDTSIVHVMERVGTIEVLWNDYFWQRRLWGHYQIRGID
jgi:hypothetical protein